MDKVLYSNKGGAWTTDAGKFFWPVEGDLHFYAYAPDVPGAADAPGTYEITSSSQKLANFSPCASAAEQKDFVYAYAKGNLTDNGTSGVDVDFKHALTEVSIAAKNDNSAYTVEVTGVKIGNIKSKGSFSFPAVNNATPASWDLSGSGVDNYETTWTTANKLGKTVSSLDASNVAFMLLPQQLTTNTKASAGNYIALKVKITMQGGKVIHDDWAYIGINTNWEMGKHYTYTLDFTTGAGQTEAGKMIISGKDIKMSVDVAKWDAKAVDLPKKVISGTARGEFAYRLSGQNSAKYIVTPDASGNWSDPVSKFNGVTTTESMFDRCSHITSLDLSHFDTSKVTDMNKMFMYCSSLTSLDLSNFNTSKVTNMYGMFSCCSHLTSLDLSHFDTSNVRHMNKMFEVCEKLTSLDLSGWNTSEVMSLDDMFNGCNSLTSLDISNFNTSKVTNMEDMFANCSSLTSLDLSHFDTSSLTYMSEMFNNCNKLTSLNLSGWNTSNVTNMEDMFVDCPKLKTIRMVGCSEATINKIKAQLATDGITGCTIVTE